MVGGGIAAALLACQMASKAYKDYESETPSYTTRHSEPHDSPTASVRTCETACCSGYFTSLNDVLNY